MKLNHIRINMLGEPRPSSSGGGSTPSDYDLQSRQPEKTHQFSPVR